jgi:hypothetical protein
MIEELGKWFLVTGEGEEEEEAGVVVVPVGHSDLAQR